MPNSPSAKKSMRKSAGRRDNNRAARSALRNVLKKARAAAEAEDKAAGETALRLAVKRLDQAAAGKLIHKNAASRLKSRLAARFNKPATAAK